MLLATTSALWTSVITDPVDWDDMGEVTTREDGSGDDEEDPEAVVRVIEGHAVQFNEYRY